ncbi:MAG: hypothetical protein JSW28_03875 [Thermoplasmata archaeon]|nr:MAG: hypothetical protein JSW28_03875 [Thermoplasmata archaeon]
MSLRGDNWGIAGPFEDIPSLIIVTVGLGIFFLSLVQTYTIYAESIELSQMYSECNDISRIVRSYDKLLANGTYTAQPTEGRFDFTKLCEMTDDQIRKDIVSDYKFNITIVQFGGVDEDGEGIVEEQWGFGYKIPTSGDITKSKVSTTIVIKVNESVFRLGQLKVTVWRST